MIKNLNFNEPFIIAEIGGNHEGDFEYAKKLLIDAADAGADAVKFQTYFSEKIVSKVENEERFKHFSRFELPIEKYIELANLAKENDVIFMSSIWDKDSLKEPHFTRYSIKNNPYARKILKDYKKSNY